jgi:hypothetical protein
MTMVSDQSYRLLDAEDLLLQGALIDKSHENEILSMHRLVQTAVIRRRDPEERRDYFDSVVDILSPSFPDTYSTDVGHQVASWIRCERSLPHLENLIKQNKNTRFLRQTISHSQSFC